MPRPSRPGEWSPSKFPRLAQLQSSREKSMDAIRLTRERSSAALPEKPITPVKFIFSCTQSSSGINTARTLRHQLSPFIRDRRRPFNFESSRNFKFAPISHNIQVTFHSLLHLYEVNFATVVWYQEAGTRTHAPLRRHQVSPIMKNLAFKAKIPG